MNDELKEQISFNGKPYRLINLEHEWTYRQQCIFKRLISKIWDRIPAGQDMDLQSMGLDFIRNLSDLNLEPEFLALIYLPVDQKKFEVRQYDEQVDFISQSTMNEINNSLPGIKKLMAEKSKDYWKQMNTFFTTFMPQNPALTQ